MLEYDQSKLIPHYCKCFPNALNKLRQVANKPKSFRKLRIIRFYLYLCETNKILGKHTVYENTCTANRGRCKCFEPHRLFQTLSVGIYLSIGDQQEEQTATDRWLLQKCTKKQLQIRKKHYNNFRQYFYRRRVFSSCDQSSQIGNHPISVDDGLRSCFCRSTSPESYGQTVWKVHLRIHGGRIIMHRPPPPWWNGIPLSKLQTKVCPTSMGWLSLSNDRDQYCRGAVWHCRGVYGS